MGISSQTLTTVSAILAETTLKKPYDANTIVLGKIKSSTAISFEKRVRILPIGFESKKTTFARTIVFAIAWCRFELLLIVMLKIVISLKVAITSDKPMSEANVLG
mmetsp:Transcript_44088/g.58516  ORF Transcript_44088/g.58516 Transcript_44088/m.58516 type:complete len:105 (-) Transcript_44088:42-356(-)